MRRRPAALAVSLLAVVVLVVAGCGGGDEPAAQSTPAATPVATETATQTAEPEAEAGQGDAPGVGGKDCADVRDDLDGDPRRQPPADLGVLSYAHLYKSERASGRAERFYAVLDGTPDELPSRRDDVQNELVQNWGFASLSAGQKDGAEATAHLEGVKHMVDVQVTPLCEGKLRIRYTVR